MFGVSNVPEYRFFGRCARLRANVMKSMLEFRFVKISNGMALFDWGKSLVGGLGNTEWDIQIKEPGL